MSNEHAAMSDVWALDLLPVVRERKPGMAGLTSTFSDEQIAAIVQMRDDGVKWEAIGRILNRPWKSCQRRYFLVKNSQDPKPVPEPVKHNRLYEEMGISTTTVWQPQIGSFGNVNKVPITLSTGVEMAWTEEQDDLLRKCVADKMTHSEAVARINEAFGTSYTRNASIGRAHRLDVDSMITHSIAGSRPRAARPVKPKAPPIRPRSSERFVPFQQLRCVEVEPRHLTLIELEPGECRYPYGGDVKGEPVTFCGCRAIEKQSYCGKHAVLTRRAAA